MRQESHRIQWQQWGNKDPQSKRDLITRSAAVRLTDAATAQNVISLLGESLNLSNDGGSLVLVGTIFHSNQANPILFEHELQLQQLQQQQKASSNPTSRSASPTTAATTTTAATSSTESFHLVRTLKANENPLQVRDAMQKVLETKQHQSLLLAAATTNTTTTSQSQNASSTSTIAPKVQWFFIPQDPSSQIPSCIELDGYATGMEDEDMDEADDEEDDDESYEDTLDPTYPDPMDMPWRRTTKSSKNEDDDDDATTSTYPSSKGTTTPKPNQKQKRARRQVQRYQQLSLHRSALDHYIVSGFLWKQSHRDPHVWRKVHCILTEDHLWFVTRIKNRSTNTNATQPTPYYGRIGLSRALMLVGGPSPTTLARIPFSWELVSARGQPHLFRAASRALQYRWTHCLRDRIQQCEENKLLQQAELIVADEAVARTKRLFSQIAVGEFMAASSDTTATPILWTTTWALQVVDYREQCRHIQHRLPTKTLVVATSGSSLSSQRSSISSQESSSSAPVLPPLEPELQMMVRSAWDLAGKLLVEALTAIHQQSPAASPADEENIPQKGGHHLRNLETLCRHIDYVLTGRMRSISEVGTDSEELIDKSRDAPPLNLFDQLLGELQKSTSL